MCLYGELFTSGCRGALGLGQEAVDGQQFHGVDKEFVARAVGCGNDAVLHLDGEELHQALPLLRITSSCRDWGRLTQHLTALNLETGAFMQAHTVDGSHDTGACSHSHTSAGASAEDAEDLDGSSTLETFCRGRTSTHSHRRTYNGALNCEPSRPI